MEYLKKIELEEAVKELDFNKVKELLGQGLSPKCLTTKWWLWNTTMDRDNAEMIKLILKHGGQRNGGLIEYIIKKKNYAKELISYIVASTPNADEVCAICFSKLMYYKGSSELEIFQLLIDHGLAVNDFIHTPGGKEITPLILSVQHSKIEFVSRLLKLGAEVEKKCDGETALHVAVSAGETKILQILLKYGGNVNILNTYELTPLHSAVLKSKVDVDLLRMLLEHGADVNASTIMGETALHLASRKTEPEIVRILLEHGADVNAVDNVGETALHAASVSGRVQIAHMLLENGADVNCLDNRNRTPLHAAAIADEHPEIFRLLLEHGADVNIEDHFEYTPISVSGNFDTQMTLIKELAKLKFKCQSVCPKNSEYLENDELDHECDHECILMVIKRCFKELEGLKARIFYKGISLYDIMNMKMKKLIALTKNKDFIAAIDSLNPCLDDSLNFYGKDLDEIFKKAVEKRNILQAEEMKMHSIFKDYVPELVTRKIAHFSVEHLFL